MRVSESQAITEWGKPTVLYKNRTTRHAAQTCTIKTARIVSLRTKRRRFCGNAKTAAAFPLLCNPLKKDGPASRAGTVIMMQNSLLYPCNSSARRAVSLNGMWRFQFDPDGAGEAAGWVEALPDPVSMPVPASFCDLFTDKDSREYCGDFWYQTDFFVPGEWNGDEVVLRFGSVTHRARVFVNGVEVAQHTGGFLPFNAVVTEIVRYNQYNCLSVLANNELSEERIPCGAVGVRSDGKKFNRPYFDFYNYAGIHRPVWLQRLPRECVTDFEIDTALDGADALVTYRVVTNGDHDVSVEVWDAGKLVSGCCGKTGTLRVQSAHLWGVGDGYLYQFVVKVLDGERVLDEYREALGLRTFAVKDGHFLLNGKPVYLRGFGKHEDADLRGRGLDLVTLKRDFACMKWIGANCFRTSHYPYAEEVYQMADEYGILVIDEVPGVGMMRSFQNFADAGSGRYTSFFEAPTVPALQSNHLQQVDEMIRRDKRHACVIAFSLFNEPETISEHARRYFAPIFDTARRLDPQKRPLTGALEKTSSPQKCQCFDLCDFICLNRYYGWYIEGGYTMPDAEAAFRREMRDWDAVRGDRPVVFTEYGADTLSTQHTLPSRMWSQEYQVEYLKMNHAVMDDFPFVQGELVWNFSDFQTTEGIMRVGGNKKGIFTRDRQPKDAAFLFRARWTTLPLDYKTCS